MTHFLLSGTWNITSVSLCTCLCSSTVPITITCSSIRCINCCVKYIIATVTSSFLIQQQLFLESASAGGLLGRLVTPARNYMSRQGYILPVLLQLIGHLVFVSSSLQNFPFCHLVWTGMTPKRSWLIYGQDFLYGSDIVGWVIEMTSI